MPSTQTHPSTRTEARGRVPRAHTTPRRAAAARRPRWRGRKIASSNWTSRIATPSCDPTCARVWRSSAHRRCIARYAASSAAARCVLTTAPSGAGCTDASARRLAPTSSTKREDLRRAARDATLALPMTDPLYRNDKHEDLRLHNPIYTRGAFNSKSVTESRLCHQAPLRAQRRYRHSSAPHPVPLWHHSRSDIRLRRRGTSIT